MAQRSLPSIFLFFFTSFRKSFIFNSNPACPYWFYCYYKRLFCASVYTGFNHPTPILLIFLGSLNFVPFSSEVPRFCVSAETKLFLKSKLLLWEGLSRRLGWYAEGCKWQGTPWTSILQIAVNFQEAFEYRPSGGLHSPLSSEDTASQRLGDIHRRWPGMQNAGKKKWAGSKEKGTVRNLCQVLIIKEFRWTLW